MRWILNKCVLTPSLSLLSLSVPALSLLCLFVTPTPTRGSHESSTPIIEFPWWQVISQSTSFLYMWHWVTWREHIMQTQTRRYTTSTVCSRSIQIHACILLCTSSWGFIFVSALTFSLSEMSVFFFFLNNECMLDMFILFSLIIHDACEKGQLHQIIWSSLSCMTCFDLHNQDQKTFMLKLFAQLCSTL